MQSNFLKLLQNKKIKKCSMPANMVFKTICMIWSVVKLVAHNNEDGKLIQTPALTAISGPLEWVKIAMSRGDSP